MQINLYNYQEEAVEKMHKGCILCGGVGSGKSITSLAYYFKEMGGSIKPFKRMTNPKDLYIITTARKRDTGEWGLEMVPFHLSTRKDENEYSNNVVIDSWNNIKKYENVKDAFFIFDEDRVIGNGAWVKAFIKIAKQNFWIILSATPADRWIDFAPVFIANGFYRNITQFRGEHCIYQSWNGIPLLKGYVNTRKLERLRGRILVDMEFKRETIPHHEYIPADYDIKLYKQVMKDRYDIYKDKPIEDAAGICYCLRKIVNSDESRIEKIREILKEKQRVIIFYNYDYELEILKTLGKDGVSIAEWNGHKHQDIPSKSPWAFLVQYNAGAEGWNCILTDTIIFYSQSYSYKTMVQASGRIDRLNTPYQDLYFYHFKSASSIDIAIDKALKEKKKFNEKKFVGVD